MKKIGIILISLVLASCTEQEVLTPVEPTTPDSNVLIVPQLSMEVSGSNETTPWNNPASGMGDRHAATRATTTYPYVTTNAEGKTTVIVSADDNGKASYALHSPWTVTPTHVETDPQNSVSYRFEVAKDDAGSIVGTSLSTTTCTSPYRLPTEREMLLIVNLRDQLTGITPLTLSNTGTTPGTYWTFTKYSGDATHYWYTEQNAKVGTTDHAVNTNSASVRCVRDVFDGFSDAEGKEVAALWGYSSPSAGSPLITDTKIKRTATGFELSTPQYYPADGNKKLYFYAYAPINNDGINYGTGIARLRLYGQTDVLWAKDDRGIAKNSNPARQEQPFFRFRHQLMQLKFKFVADASYESGNAVTNITAKGVNNIIRTNMIDGSATFSSADNSNNAQPDFSSTLAINPTTGNIVTTTGIQLKETLLIEPQPTVTLSITVGGVTYPDITITLKGTNPGTAGKSHLITLTLKRNQIVPTASMVDWTTGGSADVGAI